MVASLVEPSFGHTSSTIKADTFSTTTAPFSSFSFSFSPSLGEDEGPGLHKISRTVSRAATEAEVIRECRSCASSGEFDVVTARHQTSDIKTILD